MKGVYECEILAQSEVGPNVVRTLLKGPEIARQAQPGQFVNVRVTPTTDPLLRRPFSIHATYPDEGVYSLLYVLRGKGTALLHKARPRDKISVVGPLGKPFDLGDSSEAEHIVVAGGCGAAPLHFLCDALCRKWGCKHVTVLAGAQSKDTILCEAEFKSYDVNVLISTDDGSYGCQGYVTDLLDAYLAERCSMSSQPGNSPLIRVYSCGPHDMLKEVARISREYKVSSCQVSLENVMACGIGVCMGCVQKVKDSGHGDDPAECFHYERVCTEGTVFEADNVVWE